MSSNSIKSKVLKVIQNNPHCANDDAALLECYWTQIDGWNHEHSLYWNLSRVTPGESITRIRRKLHEEGLIEYSEDTLESRTKRFNEEREQYSMADAFGFNTNFIDRLGR